MSGAELPASLLLPVGLGLLAFIEPCAIGATLLFIKLVEGKPAQTKIAQALAFTLTRGLLMGLLGAGAARIGGAFFALQKAGWLAFGGVYAVIGLMYLTGRIRWLQQSVGPRLSRLGAVQSSMALGLVFGLNIPACAAPLLVALLTAAAAGVTPGAALGAFVSLFLFGLALSAPLVAAVAFPRARQALDSLARLTGRMPRIVGTVLLVVGALTIGFGLASTQPGA
ncbi:MAG: hypothetical protein ACT4PK_05015 [Gammaproteobacteria bacterium]|jgi:cytochrome c-type biogenesis protein